MSQIVHGVGRTLYAFAVYLCVICVPCGETLIPLLLESARRYLRPVSAEPERSEPRTNAVVARERTEQPAIAPRPPSVPEVQSEN